MDKYEIILVTNLNGGKKSNIRICEATIIEEKYIYKNGIADRTFFDKNRDKEFKTYTVSLIYLLGEYTRMFLKHERPHKIEKDIYRLHHVV